MTTEQKLRMNYIGAVSLAVRLFGRLDAYNKADEAENQTMERLAVDFNAHRFGLEMVSNGKNWMLVDREVEHLPPATPEAFGAAFEAAARPGKVGNE